MYFFVLDILSSFPSEVSLLLNILKHISELFLNFRLCPRLLNTSLGVFSYVIGEMLTGG